MFDLDFILTTFHRPISKSLSRPHYMSRFLLSNSIKFRKVSSLTLVNELCFAIIFILKHTTNNNSLLVFEHRAIILMRFQKAKRKCLSGDFRTF